MRNSKPQTPAAHGNPVNRHPKNRGVLRACSALLGAVALLGATGCTTEEGEVGADYEARSTGLLAFDSCEDLLDYFQAEATTDLSLGYG